MTKKIPTFKTNRAAAAFVDKANLTQYDLSGGQLTRFEIEPKGKSRNLRSNALSAHRNNLLTGRTTPAK